MFHASLGAQFLACLATGAVIFQWAAQRYRLASDGVVASWNQLKLSELITMVLAIGIAYTLCNRGVSRGRHGMDPAKVWPPPNRKKKWPSRLLGLNGSTPLS